MSPGDQLKTASDLGVPVVGVGLLYQQGYFRQEIDSRGRQQALYPFNDPGQLPIRPLRDAERRMAAASRLHLPGMLVWLRAWQVQVGRVRSTCSTRNDPANTRSHRGITSELYGGDAELRLKQEIVLGIGGWRLLRALGLESGGLPSERGACGICRAGAGPHLHGRTSGSLRVGADDHARRAISSRRIRPVAAGFDRFAPDLMSSSTSVATREQQLGHHR